MLSTLKILSFFLVAEAHTGLMYHRPAGENSNFSSVHTLPDNGRSISGNVAEKRYDSRHDKLRQELIFRDWRPMQSEKFLDFWKFASVEC